MVHEPTAFAPLTFESPHGVCVTVRQVRADDDAAFHAAFLQLSPESRYSRFMSVVRELHGTMRDRATHPDGEREFALVAVVDDRIVAGGRFIAIRDSENCEFALTVLDDWQGHGLGRGLLTALKAQAAARGYERIEGYVLSTNLAMRRLGQRLGFTDGPVPGDATTRLLVAGLREGTDGAGVA